MRSAVQVVCTLIALAAVPPSVHAAPASAHAGTYAGRIRWAASAGRGVIAYRVYVRPSGGQYGGGIDVGMPAADPDGTLSAIVQDLDIRTDYLLAVTALGAGDDESERSNELRIGYADVAAMFDSDGDGLSDAAEDRNLNRVVDAGETDPEQFDTDGDGTGDSNDRCPDTGRGEPVSAVGCSCAQVACDDADPCNGTERCLAGSCLAGAPLVCDDADACTDGVCVPGSGCIQVAQPGCRPCGQNTDCRATDACTMAVCRDGRCTSDAMPDGTDCGDGNPCNGIETCVSGRCAPGAALTCDDGNACTIDHCDAARGCVHAAEPGCQACGSSYDCDDMNACTTDICDGGRCGYIPGACGPTSTLLFSRAQNRSGAIPLDGATVSENVYVFVDPEDGIRRVEFYLDDTERRAAPMQIEKKPPYDLAGGSRSAANPFDTGTLPAGEHILTAAVWRTDGTTEVLTGAFHVGALLCDRSSVCDDDNPCTVDECVPGMGCTHVPVPDGTGCGTGDLCQGAETCHSGACAVGTSLRCDDGNACTVDVCVAHQGCTYETVPGCRRCAAASDCDDGDRCTDDICGAGRCEHTRADACGPEQPYEIMLSFAPDRADAVPLDGEAIRGDSYVFVSPPVGIERVRFYVDDPGRRRAPRQTERNSPFDLGGGSVGAARAFDATALGIGEHVITAEIKHSGGALAVVSTPFTVEHPLCTRDAACDDGNPCTENACDPQLGCLTASRPDASPCSDGLFCNGLETCWNAVCRPGRAPECDDGNLCTEDSCDESASRCAHAGISGCCVSDEDCADDDLCTEAERCEGRRCVSVPVHCGDAGGCLETACDPEFGCRAEVSPDGTACKSVDPCAEMDLCVRGSCEAANVSRLEHADLRLGLDRRGRRLLGRAMFPMQSRLDPATSGIVIELLDASGAGVYRSEVSGDAFSVNRDRTVFKHVTRVASRNDGRNGRRKLVLKHRSGGRMSVILKIVGADLPAATNAQALTWVVRAGNACASAVELHCVSVARRLIVCR